jgi:hypothetical protein
MTSANLRKKPFYTGMSFQVLVMVGIAIGYVNPHYAVAIKPPNRQSQRSAIRSVRTGNMRV